jgi:hypothetical protein
VTLADLAAPFIPGARNVAALLGILQPIAETRITRTPVYAYRSDTTPEAGYNARIGDAIFLNRKYEDDPEAWPAMTRHESTHQALKPLMSDLAKDPVLSDYISRIQAGLVKEKSPIYAGASPDVAISEALAYGTYDPHMPGLTADESRAVYNRAMALIDAAKPEIGSQVRRLYRAKLSDLTNPTPRRQ